MTRTTQLRLCLGTLFAFAMAFCVFACASVPVSEETVLVVPVDNQLLERVVISLNGIRIAELAPMESRAIAVRESVLTGGRCATAVALLPDSRVALHSTEECLMRGGHFTLSVAVGRHLWLNPWQ